VPERNQPWQGHLSLLKRTIEIHLNRLVAWDGCSPNGLCGAVLTKMYRPVPMAVGVSACGLIIPNKAGCIR
jgi:hypothetical protein